MRFDLSDEEWAVIEPLLPRRIRGPVRVDDRKEPTLTPCQKQTVNRAVKIRIKQGCVFHSFGLRMDDGDLP